MGLAGGADIWDGFQASDINDKQNDPYIAQLMRQSMHRLPYVQANSSAMNGLASTDRVVAIMTWWQKALIAIDVAFAALAVGSVVMLIRSKKKSQ